MPFSGSSGHVKELPLRAQGEITGSTAVLRGQGKINDMFWIWGTFLADRFQVIADYEILLD
jgi:hypothetical protein